MSHLFSADCGFGTNNIGIAPIFNRFDLPILLLGRYFLATVRTQDYYHHDIKVTDLAQQVITLV